VFNGTARADAAEVELTPAAGADRSGTAFWPERLDPRGLTVDFDTSIGGGTGADGLTLILADATRGAAATALGAAGGGLGFAGVPGVAVALDTHANAGDPAGALVGITDGPAAGGAPDSLHWLAAATPPGSLRGTHHVRVVAAGGVVTVTLDGTELLRRAVALPAAALLGFGAATGSLTDRHAISGLEVRGVQPPPAGSLGVSSRVAGAPDAPRVSFTGTCPATFSTGPVASGQTVTPVLAGARAGDACSVAQTVPPGPGWSVTAAVDGGAPVQLAVDGGMARAPAFWLREGKRTVAFVTTWRQPPEPPATPPAPSGPAAPAPVLRAGPAGWWSFAEGAGRIARDGSGRGHAGRIAGARWTAAGRSGRALHFGAPGDRVTIPGVSSLPLTRGLTLEAWVKPARSLRGRPSVLDKQRASGAVGWGLYTGSRRGGWFSTGRHACRVGARLRAGHWTHLAATWDGRVLVVYVGGRRVASRRLAGAIAPALGPLRIGGGAFRGRVDEVRVYDGALSRAEIAADMVAPGA
jgi:hypothetical protein